MGWWPRLAAGKVVATDSAVTEPPPSEIVPQHDAPAGSDANDEVRVDLSELKSRHADLLQEFLIVFQRHSDLGADQARSRVSSTRCGNGRGVPWIL